FAYMRIVHSRRIMPAADVVHVALMLLVLLASALLPAQSVAQAGEVAADESADLTADPAADSWLFPQTGFRIERNAFRDYFQRRGGERTFGYPVSRAFSFLGCVSQFFQREVLQQCPG